MVRCGKVHAKFHEALNVLRTFFDHDGDHLQVAQASTGIKGVSNMQFRTVIAVNRGGYAPLRPVCIGGGTLFFCYDCNFGVLCYMNSKIEAPDAAANYQDISFDRFRHSIPRSTSVKQKNCYYGRRTAHEITVVQRPFSPSADWVML